MALRGVFLLAGILLCFLNFYGSLYLPDVVHYQHVEGLNSKMAFHKSNKQQEVLTTQEQRPTHKACHGYNGIYHIAMTDIVGGVGTALIQLVLGQLLYAQDYNLKPWVFLNNRSEVFFDPKVHGDTGRGISLVAMVGRNASYVSPSRQGYRSWKDYVPGPPDASAPVAQQRLYFQGTGVWNHYFYPVSDFVPGDRSCESKLYVTMDLYLITPGIHGFSNRYATRAWRYDYLPEYITQPHVPLHEWLWPQRQRAHQVLQQYIRFRPHLHAAAVRVNPNCTRTSNPCLGLHIRHSDKAAGRRQIPVVEFLPFAMAFVNQGGTQIYLATDSNKVIEEIQLHWPKNVISRIKTLDDKDHLPQNHGHLHDGVIRSNEKKAVFDMAPHDRTNQEALVEILALSRCQFLVHGLSALSESSIWINLDLHHRSVNLEDPDHLNETMFAELVRQSLMENDGNALTPEKLPRPPQTDRWWDLLPVKQNEIDVNQKDVDSCRGFDGILHIANVAKGDGVGRAFFTSILNQFIFAEQFNLKPWVQLSCQGANVVFDSSFHSIFNVSFQATSYSLPVFVDGQWRLFTGLNSTATERKTFTVQGCNLWDSYFESVSSARSDGGSCGLKPVFVLSQNHKTDFLESKTPWSIRAWRYDDVSEAVWNPNGSTQLKEIVKPARVKGHEIVKKYFRFQQRISEQANRVNPITDGDVCLAVHIHATEKKGKYRKKVTAEKYIPYLEEFARSGGNVIYLATDSSRAMKYLYKEVSDAVKSLLRSQGTFVVRSSSKSVPPHVLDGHHRVNSETLVDIMAMSKCHLLLHSSSTVPEAVHYININLHDKSINLEDSEKLSVPEFGAMVKRVIGTMNTA